MERKLQILKPNNEEFRIDSKAQLRVCAYCRVSTEEEDQRHSLNSQRDFFESMFSSHSNWINSGIFADEGLSGTSLEKREAFNRMLSLARAGLIDIIITKEVSRFSRNTRDLLNIVDELKRLKVYIWFLSDDINTEDNSATQRLTEIATSAQAESLRTSRRVLWGQAQQMQRGIVFGRKEMFGYKIIRNGSDEQSFEIVEEEAEIIKQIFDLFSNGEGTYSIARKLNEKGISTEKYKGGWSTTVILRILRNEKYVGDLVQGKTYTPNPLDHKKKYNMGKSNRYIIKNHHPDSAIVDRKTWDKVQAILNRHSQAENLKYTNRYWCSGKVFCGICGQRYVSYNRSTKNDYPYRAWVCSSNHEFGKLKKVDTCGEIKIVGCNGKRVNDKVLIQAVHDILSQIISNRKDKVLNSIINQLYTSSKPLSKSNIKEKKEKAKAEKEELLVDLTLKFSSGKITESIYSMALKTVNREIDKLNIEINNLNLRSNSVEISPKEKEYYVSKIIDLLCLSNNDKSIGLYERITEKIIVRPENILEIYLTFLCKPIIMQYKTHGKGESYTAEFMII